MQIDIDFDLLTLDGEVFNARRLLGRPTILVLLRYLPLVRAVILRFCGKT